MTALTEAHAFTWTDRKPASAPSAGGAGTAARTWTNVPRTLAETAAPASTQTEAIRVCAPLGTWGGTARCTMVRVPRIRVRTETSVGRRLMV